MESYKQVGLCRPPHSNKTPSTSLPSTTSSTQGQASNGMIQCVSNAPCPCCMRSLRTMDDQMTLDEPKKPEKGKFFLEKDVPSLLTSCEDDTEVEFDNDLLPGTLSTGVEYKPTSMLVEGWVHKKGTGNDWLGSTAWKARYAKLVLAKVDGYKVEVPLLLIYWFQHSETPSTVLSLDSTVVIPIDNEDTTKWNSYEWHVIHARDEQQCTRIFTAPRKGRNAWVSMINSALVTYEKAKSVEKKYHQQQLLRKNRPTSPTFTSEDRFVAPKRASFSPPSSPRPTERRPLPRPDKLIGEELLR